MGYTEKRTDPPTLEQAKAAADVLMRQFDHAMSDGNGANGWLVLGHTVAAYVESLSALDGLARKAAHLHAAALESYLRVLIEKTHTTPADWTLCEKRGMGTDANFEVTHYFVERKKEEAILP